MLFHGMKKFMMHRGESHDSFNELFENEGV